MNGQKRKIIGSIRVRNKSIFFFFFFIDYYRTCKDVKKMFRRGRHRIFVRKIYNTDNNTIAED